MTFRMTWRRGSVVFAIALQSCVVFVPNTTRVFNPQCQLVARQMTLEPVQLGSLEGCRNQECAALILASLAVTTASLIVSGSIVVAGNVAYWFEERVACQPVT
ncbi:hypothetical protein BH10PSE17_BH10PSE17_10840 [soil metagenome]